MSPLMRKAVNRLRRRRKAAVKPYDLEAWLADWDRERASALAAVNAFMAGRFSSSASEPNEMPRPRNADGTHPNGDSTAWTNVTWAIGFTLQGLAELCDYLNADPEYRFRAALELWREQKEESE